MHLSALLKTALVFVIASAVAFALIAILLRSSSGAVVPPMIAVTAFYCVFVVDMPVLYHAFARRRQE